MNRWDLFSGFTVGSQGDNHFAGDPKISVFVGFSFPSETGQFLQSLPWVAEIGMAA